VRRGEVGFWKRGQRWKSFEMFSWKRLNVSWEAERHEAERGRERQREKKMRERQDKKD
jgi:hypothetical protein